MSVSIRVAPVIIIFARLNEAVYNVRDRVERVSRVRQINGVISG